MYRFLLVTPGVAASPCVLFDDSSVYVFAENYESRWISLEALEIAAEGSFFVWIDTVPNLEKYNDCTDPFPEPLEILMKDPRIHSVRYDRAEHRFRVRFCDGTEWTWFEVEPSTVADFFVAHQEDALDPFFDDYMQRTHGLSRIMDTWKGEEA